MKIKSIKMAGYDHTYDVEVRDCHSYLLHNGVVCHNSSVVGNSTNGMEPPRSLISIKQSKQGMLKQVVPEINKIGHQYTTAWEMPDNKGYTGIAAIAQKWIDQSISSNHYYDFTKYPDGSLPISVVIDDLFYAYSLGIKTLYYANTNDGKTDDDDAGTGCAGGACSV